MSSIGKLNMVTRYLPQISFPTLGGHHRYIGLMSVVSLDKDTFVVCHNKVVLSLSQ